MMRGVVITIVLWLTAVPCLACSPPPGLAMPQWYEVCGPEMQDAYGHGLFNNMAYDDFVGMVYQRYVASSSGGTSPSNQPQPIGPQQCTLGESECFNGWERHCERRGVADMWITGAQRCN